MPAARDTVALTDAFQEARLAMDAGNLSTDTMDDYGEKFGLFVAYLRKELRREPTVGDFNHANAVAYLAVRRHGRTARGKTRSDHTLKADALALRATSKWLNRANVTRTHRLRDLATPETSEPDGRVLHLDELQGLFAAASGISWTQRREQALLATLFDGGMRVSEFSALDADDYEPRTGGLRIWHPAKRGRSRITAMGRSARELLVASRGTRRSSGPLFTRIGGTGKPLTEAAVRSLLVRLSEKAGIARVSPQDFRRTSSTQYLLAGMDPDLHRLTFGWSRVGPDARLRYIVLSDAERAALVARYSPVDRLELVRRGRRGA